VLPRADPEPPAAATPYRCTLRIERDAAETEPGRYRGALALSHPVATEPDGAPVAARLDLDVRLAPGQSREWSFATTRPLGTARLALKSEETALTGADLFVGSANLRPFDDLARLDLERLWPAVVDRGGYRAPTAVWLGCRRVAASTP
jgi:hypothetical protein